MTALQAAANPAGPLRASDVRGLTQLGFDAALGITDLVEAMHHTIVARAGIVGTAPAGRTSGITGFVYTTVRGSTRWVGRGLNVVLRAVTPDAAPDASSPRREAALAVLNGLWGDHMAASDNPLAIPTTLRAGGQALDLDTEALAARFAPASGKLLVLVHGLCMNDLQWMRNGHDHGQALARDLGYSPVYLHYNSGRHVSESGHDLDELLERLVAHWPVPVEELVIVGHSMGGLVARSACHQAKRASRSWMSALTKLVFLGTPHHGAALERGGHQVDVRSASARTWRRSRGWARPAARASRTCATATCRRPTGAAATVIRSDTTIGDRRRCRRVWKPSSWRPPRPQESGGLHSKVIGDGLVPLASALGEHRDPQRTLKVRPHHMRIVTSTDHWDLLDREDVYAQLRAWLA